jgi:hypothetical protein
MTEILTSRGMMDEAELSFIKGHEETDNWFVEWEEWWASDGELVKRNAHVTLKRGLGALIEQGAVG